jgi:hypothetical protein
MSTRWYEKAIITSPYIVNGKAVPFEAIAGNHGVLALDSEKDAPMIKSLEEAIAKGVGGVGRVTEDQFNSLKKKLWTPPAPKSWLDEPLKISGKKITPVNPLAKKVEAAAQAAKPAPVAATKAEPEVPQRPPDQPDFRTSDFKPATRKLGKLAETPGDV